MRSAALDHRHERPPADSLAIALAQLNPTVGDVAGNADKVRRARAEAAGAGRRPRASSRAVHRRLSAGGPGAQAGVPGRLPRGGRGARARDRRRRPGAAGRHALGRGRQALQRLSRCSTAARSRRCATRSTCRTTACSTRSACSRRARCRARSCSAACASAFRSARTSGAPDVVECIAETGGEILLVPNGSPYWRDKTDDAAQHRGRARGRERPAAGLSQQVGGQDELVFDGASFVPECRPLARVPASGVPRGASSPTQWVRENGGWRCAAGPRSR